MSSIHQSGHWGEGSVSAMRHREALMQVLQSMPRTGAKPHGLGPSPGNCLTGTRKRAFRRACKRCLVHGHAWYHGLNYAPSDFPAGLRASVTQELQRQAFSANSADCLPVQSPASPNRVHAPKRRLKLFQWNPSGLSSARYHELLHWLSFQSFDVVCLSETRWRQDMEWLTPAWACIHTGDPHGQSGVLILVSRQFCPAHKISWQVAQPGRLLHVRLHVGLRPYDLLGAYQWPHSHANKSRRQAFFTGLDQLLTGLPRCNLFAMLGDFNTSVRVAGTSKYTWQHGSVHGAQHTDSGVFEQLLQQHDLCILNAWNQTDGPTFQGPLSTSRIDFIIGRQKQIDGLAKLTNQLPEMPMIPASGGHIPILATLPRCWIPYKSEAVDSKFRFRHRMLSRHLHVTQDPHWLGMIDQTQMQLMQVHAHQLAVPSILPRHDYDETHLDRLHAVLTDSFQTFLDQHADKPVQQTLPLDSFHTTVECKWNHWKQLKALTVPNLHSFFQAWRCWTRFHCLGRQQSKVAKQRKTAQVQELTRQAGYAANRNDLFRLYHLVNRFTPRQRKSRIQLRNHTGSIASPVEELAILGAYVKRIWYDPDALLALHYCQPYPPGVPFSLHDLIGALQQAPIVKAVAAPFPPNLVWKCNAAQIADIVYQDLQRWWHQWPPHIPAIWQRGWLVFIGKPNRQPNAPQNLRALAMQEPVGKAILKLLTSQLQAATFGTFSRFPQMAYMQARDTQDALIRVVHHCAAVKQLMRTQTTSLRHHDSASPKLNCFGGIQMFVDLEKAFDMAPRAEVFKSLVQLGVPPALISLLGTWHSNTSYIVTHHNMTDSHDTNRGVRQGCVAAPQLWGCLMHMLMEQYGKIVGLEWLLYHLTIFADDIHLCQLIHTAADLQSAIDRFGQFITCAHDLGLQINFQKTEVLLRLAGRFHSHAQSKHVLCTEHGVFLRVPYGHNKVARIPLKASVTYLGVCITYQNLQKATAFTTVRARKLHMWLTHGYLLKHSRPVQIASESLQGMPYCKHCDIEFANWKLFQRHMALHVDINVSQVTTAELSRQLAAMPTALEPAPAVKPAHDDSQVISVDMHGSPAASQPIANVTAPVSQPEPADEPAPSRSTFNAGTSPPAQFQTSALFDKARATAVGARALQLIHAHDWPAIKADDAVKQWLSLHCVVCNVVVGGLKRMNMHMRQHHQALIDGLYPTAGTVLKRCGTASPCELCQKEFQVEHLCPAIIQASMVLIHELPLAASDEPSLPAADASLGSMRTRRLVVHDFVLARDGIDGTPQCSHGRRQFATVNGLKLHISLGKCPQFDINRSRTPVAPDAELLQHLRDGTLILWLEDAFRRMQWTCHCKTCGLRFTGAATLANHLQMAHSDLWHSATTCTSFLSAYVNTIHRCVCNPSPGHMRTEHQCLVLRQIAMQYVRARDAGLYPGLLMPYRIDASELSVIMPFASAELCDLILNMLTTHQMAPFWSSPLLQVLRWQCTICGHEASDQALVDHLSSAHSLALNSAMMLQANLAAMVFSFFQCCTSQPTCPLCAAVCAEMSVQQHLALCPVLHQLAWILSNPCHGRSGRNGVPSFGATRRCLPTHEPSPGQALSENLGPGNGQPGCPAGQAGQGNQQWQGQDQRTGQGPSKRRRSGPCPSGAHPGKIGSSSGPAASTTKSKLLPDLFHQQSRGKYTQGPGLNHGPVGSPCGAEQGDKEPEKCPLGNHPMLPGSTSSALGRDTDPTIAQAQKVGLLLQDRSWPFQEWSSHKQMMVQTTQLPKKMEAMLKCLQALEESSKDSQLVLSFHTMKPLPQDQLPPNHSDVQVYPWRLALNPRDDDTWNLMTQLQGSAVWNLLGIRYKQASMKPSALTQQLEHQLRQLR
eukprot:s1727_g15.t1